MATTKSLIFDLFGRDRTASKTMKGVGDNASRMAKKVRGASKVIGVGIGAASVAIGAFAIVSLKAFAESETAQNKLAFAFQKFPKLADTSVVALQKYNTELAKKTYFDDDALASGEAILAQYKLTGKQIKEITPLVADYAAKTGRSFEEAATVIGKAVLGNGKALKDVGIKFTDTGTAAGNFGELIKTLGGTVSGFAESDLKTASGRVKDLMDRFDEVKESIGQRLLPIMVEFMDFFEKSVLPKIETLAVFIMTKAVPALKEFKNWFSQNKDVLVPLAVVFGVLGAAIGIVIAALTVPVTTALIASLVFLALKISEVLFFIDQMKSVGPKSFEKLGRQFADFGLTVANGFIDALIVLNKFVQNSTNMVIEKALNPLIAALNIILGMLGVGKINMIAKVDFGSNLQNIKNNFNGASGAGGGGGGGGVGGSGYRPPPNFMAYGGIVQARPGGTSAVIGEAGHAEAVIPLSAGALSKYGLGGGTTVNVNLSGTYAGSKTDLARTVTRAIVNAQKIGAVPRGQLA